MARDAGVGASDPWRDIARPPASGRLNARRVSADCRWDLYWAVDATGDVLLVLSHAALPEQRARRLPALKALRMEHLSDEDSGRRSILIRLTEGEHRDLFRRFCEDMVEATSGAETEVDAVARFVSRTWRWHSLLRTGRLDRLTDEQQRGLVGELDALRLEILPAIGAAGAVRSWSGPLDAPHDFEVGRLRVECKALGPAATAVRISSEIQLGASPNEDLWLHVAQVSPAPAGGADALNLTERATRLRDILARDDLLAADHFEERLHAAGFDWRHNYSDKSWLVAGRAVYEVRDKFPRITEAMCPTGVGRVRYDLTLTACEDFRADREALGGALRRTVV